MELEYALQEDDMIALSELQMARSETIQRRRRMTQFGYVLVFALLAVVDYFVYPRPYMAIGLAVLALFFAVGYPYLYRRQLRKRIRVLVQEKETAESYATTRLQAIPGGLEQIGEHSRWQTDWSTVDDIYETNSRTFISVQGTYALVIPRDRVKSDEYDAFMAAVQDYRASATQSDDKGK